MYNKVRNYAGQTIQRQRVHETNDFKKRRTET